MLPSPPRLDYQHVDHKRHTVIVANNVTTGSASGELVKLRWPNEEEQVSQAAKQVNNYSPDLLIH
jgi:hypothetical protein